MLTAVKRSISISNIDKSQNPTRQPRSNAITGQSNYIIVVFATRMDFGHWRA